MMAALRTGDSRSFERGGEAPLTFDYAYVDDYAYGTPQLGEPEQNSIALARLRSPAPGVLLAP
jgi:hypothetical protein